MRAVLQTIQEGFPFVFAAQTAAEIEDGVIISQRQGVQKYLQFLESIVDFLRVTFVGLRIGQV